MNVEELKLIVMFGDLNEKMLEKISKITDIIEYKAEDYIFRKDEPASYLFSVQEGEVDLEIDIGNSAPIHLQGITPNFTFGISSLVDMDEKTYVKNAKTVTDSKIYRWKATELTKLFTEDYELGYLFMKRISKILKTRFTAKASLIADLCKYMRSG